MSKNIIKIFTKISSKLRFLHNAKMLAKMQNRCYNRLTGKELTEVPERTYLAIDLKSFYASVECIERGLNPMTTNLVVADASRTEKTICLAA